MSYNTLQKDKWRFTYLCRIWPSIIFLLKIEGGSLQKYRQPYLSMNLYSLKPTPS